MIETPATRFKHYDDCGLKVHCIATILSDFATIFSDFAFTYDFALLES